MKNQLHTSILSSIALILGIMGCSQEKTAPKQDSVLPQNPALLTLLHASVNDIGLTTEVVSQKPFTKSIAVPAKVLANQDNEAHVGSLVQGRVCKVFVKAGDFVKAGQELMLVEGLEIGEIKAGFLSAKAELEFQKANFERQKALVEQNVAAQKNLLEAQSLYEKARADYAAEMNRIHAIGLTESEVIDGTNIHSQEHGSGILPVKSPISGTIVERNVVLGQLIEATTTAFKIINLNSVWVDAQISEKDLSKVALNSIADFIASAYPDQLLKGKLNYIGQTIDEQTRTITLRAEFDNAAGKLKPQMFGELHIRTGANSLALSIPLESIVKIDNIDYIFIQKSDTTFEKTPITIGSVQNEIAEILSGLSVGDKVVTKGAFYLKSELLKSLLGGE